MQKIVRIAGVTVDEEMPAHLLQFDRTISGEVCHAGTACMREETARAVRCERGADVEARSPREDRSKRKNDSVT